MEEQTGRERQMGKGKTICGSERWRKRNTDSGRVTEKRRKREGGTQGDRGR
jgi:hypothetical protein